MSVRVGLLGLVCACSATRLEPDRDVPAAPEVKPAAPEAAAPPPARELLILVNTPYALYRVNPVTLDVIELAVFTFSEGGEAPITDISIDRRGRMWGISYRAVYRIDPRTAAVTPLAEAPNRNLNSLAIMTAMMAGGTREDPDILIAGDWGGPVLQIDSNDGTQHVIGNLGGVLGSSGDLTWSPEAGAVMTVTDRAGFEALAKLEQGTFTATPIGDQLGFRNVRGLALGPTGLLGFTEAGEIISIDATTGVGTLKRRTHHMFYGAAVGYADSIR